MQSIIDYLEQLDLSDIESKLYLALLESGPTTIRELAETIKIKRTTAYFHVDLLIEKGLVIRIVKGAKKQVAANEPAESLKNLIEEKMKSAKHMQTQFPTMLKDISAAYPHFKEIGETEIKYYKGKHGVKKIYEEVLSSKEIRSYVNIEEVLKVFPENSQLFDNAINSNKEMMLFEIVEDSQHARKQIEPLKQKGKYFYKLLPENMSMQATDIFIYDGKVSFINLKEKMNGIVLQNMELYNNLKALYDLLWKLLPE